MSLRVVLALVAAALACALGGVILGEYEFTGLTPIPTGVLFGLVISEIVIEIGRVRAPALAVITAAMVAGALYWAAWISSGDGLKPFPSGGWIAMACGALAAGWRTGGWRSERDDEADDDREDVRPAG